MKLGIIKIKNNPDFEVILFKYNKLEDPIIFNVLNFSDNFEPPEYIKEIMKLTLKKKFLMKFMPKKEENATKSKLIKKNK